ncbi:MULTISPECIES: HPr family phosphocarrier protein [Rhodospirillales]|uniref:Phosphocarrier proteinhPr, putative n=2 Tax=Rhodospirillales TaxID=204441 RepID=B6IVB6_RHOCS|nr:HPr family phosphocarrier protein [Rhodospirillum centenum]ACJ00240.1 phosphocarrier proteinhPr, putative [Rhodospirillum centenum SW]
MDVERIGGGDALTAVLLIQNRRGLHARAAAKFVRLAAEYDAEVEVTRGDQTVSGQSIMGLMMLAAGLGTSVHLAARGPQAAEALAALADLVGRKFDED